MNPFRRSFILAAILLSLGGGALYLVFGSAPEPRPVELVITASEGEAFALAYTADGVEHRLSAVAPARIVTRVRERFVYEVGRGGGEAEFRVTLEVAGTKRVSSVGRQGAPVRGGVRFTGESEAVWGG